MVVELDPHATWPPQKKKKKLERGPVGGMRVLIWESGFTKPCCWELVKGARTG